MCSRSDSCMKIASVITSCVGTLMAGSNLAFWSYSYTLKKKFNYTQTTVEMIRSVTTIATFMGLPAGILFERVGPKWTSLIALCLSLSSYLFLYTTTLIPRFYHYVPWLQCLYFAFSGFGSVCMAIPCVRIGIDNISSRHRAKAVGLFNSCYMSGPAIFSLLFGTAFVGDQNHNVEEQNLGGFYIMMAIVFVIVGLFCVFFLREYTVTDNGECTEATALISDDNTPCDNVTGLNLIRRLDFQCLFWACLFASGSQMTILNNQVVCIKSFGFEKYTTILSTMSSLPGIISGLVVGVLSDALLSHVSRSVFILVMCIVQTFVFIAAIFFSYNLIVLIILILTMGFGDGVISSLTSTILSESYGMIYFARNFGSFMIGLGMWIMVLQGIFGWIYENGVSGTKTNDCYGLHCFTWSFVICGSLSFFSVFLTLALLYRDVLNRKRQLNPDQDTYNLCKSDDNFVLDNLSK